MINEARTIANNPHVKVRLFAQWNGLHHVSVEIEGKPPGKTTRGKTQLAQLSEKLTAAGIPHLHLGPEEMDGSQVGFLERISKGRRKGGWGIIVFHSRSAPGNKKLTQEEELKIRQVYQALRSNGVTETKVRNP